jgi:hypothetical protein
MWLLACQTLGGGEGEWLWGGRTMVVQYRYDCARSEFNSPYNVCNHVGMVGKGWGSGMTAGCLR